MVKYSCRCLSVVFSIIYLFILLSCESNDTHSKPNLTFVNNSGYQFSDTSLGLGEKIKVLIKATKGDGEITYLNIVRDAGSRQIVLDSGMHCNTLFYTCFIEKSIADTEIWIFKIMDKYRMKDSIKLVLTVSGGANFSPIKTYQVSIGAQDNALTGCFFNFSNNKLFNLEQAYNNQPEIDFIFYYGQYEHTFSSPAENDALTVFSGIYGISNWTVKNETRYVNTPLVATDFDKSNNDSLIITAYDEVLAKKKAKNVKTGMIVAFKNASNKKGLIKVLSIVGNENGNIDLEIKIQE